MALNYEQPWFYATSVAGAWGIQSQRSKHNRLVDVRWFQQYINRRYPYSRTTPLKKKENVELSTHRTQMPATFERNIMLIRTENEGYTQRHPMIDKLKIGKLSRCYYIKFNWQSICLKFLSRFNIHRVVSVLLVRPELRPWRGHEGLGWKNSAPHSSASED